MARRNSTWLLIVLVVLLIAFGAYTVWGREGAKSETEASTPKAEIEYVPPPDPGASQGDDIEIIEAAEEPAFQVGFGMGPGLYGSGRATSEMIGN